MSDDRSYSYTVRLTSDGDKFFGPGVARLLRLVEENGSLRKAASAMNMAYSKAWRIVGNAEKVLGYPLMSSRSGGRDGGGATVTKRGEEFLMRYEAFVAALDVQADRLYAEFFGTPDSETGRS